MWQPKGKPMPEELDNICYSLAKSFSVQLQIEKQNNYVTLDYVGQEISFFYYLTNENKN